jgi:uncharacterized protein YjiS (DUF1127 family)
MGSHDFSARHVDPQQRRGFALAAAILWSTRVITGRAQSAAALSRRAIRIAIMWNRRARERAELLSLNERALRDLGLSRYDALREGRKPFWRA